jgi:heme oxygenase (mycobilin-producing)
MRRERTDSPDRPAVWQAADDVSVVLINLFEVGPEADAAFVTGWRRARDYLARRDGFGETALHRSLADQAAFRFVNIASVDDVEAWRAAVGDPDFPGRGLPGTPNPGLYEVAREDPSDPADAGAVLVNAFEVMPRDDEAFLAGWERARDVLREQDGYLGTRLHRSLPPGARFRWVNVSPWSAPDAFFAALQQPAFQRAAKGIPFPSHPALYDVVSD